MEEQKAYIYKERGQKVDEMRIEIWPQKRGGERCSIQTLKKVKGIVKGIIYACEVSTYFEEKYGNVYVSERDGKTLRIPADKCFKIAKELEEAGISHTYVMIDGVWQKGK